MIDVWLSKLKTAVFVKDVLKAIEEAIKECYIPGAKAGNPNLEIIYAKGEYNTLKDKLNSIS